MSSGKNYKEIGKRDFFFLATSIKSYSTVPVCKCLMWRTRKGQFKEEKLPQSRPSDGYSTLVTITSWQGHKKLTCEVMFLIS